MSQTQTYRVRGMTCGHCAWAVTSELHTLGTVTDVAVDLVLRKVIRP
ncbi:MAG: heavy-metal-associated domain-containing protein [Mycobacterium sp.]